MKCDRRALVVSDLVEAEEFYVAIFGDLFEAYLANRYMLSTYEQVQGRKAAAVARRRGAAEDAEDMALPSSRIIVGAARQTHVYLHLSARHWPEPPPEQLRGASRLALRATPDQMDLAVEALARNNIAFEGPVAYSPPSPIARALYFRDRSGNFLELVCPSANGMPTPGGEIHHLVLPVADLQRSQEFYEETVGLPVLGRDVFPGEPQQLCLGLDGGQHLVLVREAAPASPPLVCAFFSLTKQEWPGLVERLDRDQRQLAADPRGGLRGAGELRLRLRDPDGHALEFHTFEDQFYALPPAGRGKIAVGRVEDFLVGSVTRVPEGKFYLVRLEGGFLAISEVCTHRQFTVAYQPEHYCFACPLHGNRYSRTGRLIHRGARENTPPLHVYPIQFEDGVVVVDTDATIPRAEEEADTLVPLPLAESPAHRGGSP